MGVVAEASSSGAGGWLLLCCDKEGAALQRSNGKMSLREGERRPLRGESTDGVGEAERLEDGESTEPRLQSEEQGEQADVPGLPSIS